MPMSRKFPLVTNLPDLEKSVGSPALASSNSDSGDEAPTPSSPSMPNQHLQRKQVQKDAMLNGFPWKSETTTANLKQNSTDVFSLDVDKISTLLAASPSTVPPPPIPTFAPNSSSPGNARSQNAVRHSMSGDIEDMDAIRSLLQTTPERVDEHGEAADVMGNGRNSNSSVTSFSRGGSPRPSANRSSTRTFVSSVAATRNSGLSSGPAGRLSSVSSVVSDASSANPFISSRRRTTASSRTTSSRSSSRSSNFSSYSAASSMGRPSYSVASAEGIPGGKNRAMQRIQEGGVASSPVAHFLTSLDAAFDNMMSGVSPVGGIVGGPDATPESNRGSDALTEFDLDDLILDLETSGLKRHGVLRLPPLLDSVAEEADPASTNRALAVSPLPSPPAPIVTPTPTPPPTPATRKSNNAISIKKRPPTPPPSVKAERSEAKNTRALHQPQPQSQSQSQSQSQQPVFRVTNPPKRTDSNKLQSSGLTFIPPPRARTPPRGTTVISPDNTSPTSKASAPTTASTAKDPIKQRSKSPPILTSTSSSSAAVPEKPAEKVAPPTSKTWSLPENTSSTSKRIMSPKPRPINTQLSAPSAAANKSDIGNAEATNSATGTPGGNMHYPTRTTSKHEGLARSGSLSRSRGLRSIASTGRDSTSNSSGHSRSGSGSGSETSRRGETPPPSASSATVPQLPPLPHTLVNSQHTRSLSSGSDGKNGSKSLRRRSHVRVSGISSTAGVSPVTSTSQAKASNPQHEASASDSVPPPPPSKHNSRQDIAKDEDEEEGTSLSAIIGGYNFDDEIDVVARQRLEKLQQEEEETQRKLKLFAQNARARRGSKEESPSQPGTTDAASLTLRSDKSGRSFGGIRKIGKPVLLGTSNLEMKVVPLRDLHKQMRKERGWKAWLKL